MKHKIPFIIKLNLFVNFFSIVSLIVSFICIYFLAGSITLGVVNDYKLKSNTHTTEGIIIDVLYHENDFASNIFEYVYEYTAPNDERITSFSYSTKNLGIEQPEIKAIPNATEKEIEQQQNLLRLKAELMKNRRTVTVEYSTDNPYRSRIVGMRTTLRGYTPLHVCWVLIPTLIVFFVQLRNSFRKIDILDYGEFTWANFISQRTTLEKFEDEQVYELKYNYTTKSGSVHSITTRTFNPGVRKIQRARAVIYNRNKEQDAILVFDEWTKLPDSLRNVFPEYFSK